MTVRVLVVDDQLPFRVAAASVFELLDGFEVVGEAASAEDAWSVLQTRVFDLVLSDINMPGMSGLDLVPQILERSPDTVVVMISGEPGIESAIEALRAGAFDYISKPIDILHVQAAVDRALGHHRLLADKRRYENHLEELVRERTAEIEHLAYYDRLTDLAYGRHRLHSRSPRVINGCSPGASSPESGLNVLAGLDLIGEPGRTS